METDRSRDPLAATTAPAPRGQVPPLHELPRVGSTQDEAAARRAAGEEAPLAVLAAEQTAGRGRLGRPFSSPPEGSLALTLAWRTPLPPSARSWLPLAVGVAAVAALRTVTGATGMTGVGLKWPNDLVTAEGRKLGGILAEARGADTVLLGIGVNLLGPVRGPDGEPVPGAAWLHGPDGLLPGPSPTGAGTAALRRGLAEELLAGLTGELAALEAEGGRARADGLRDRYTMTCLTVGRPVRVHPLGATGAEDPSAWDGLARGVDEAGRLLVEDSRGHRHAVDVGDVRHLRSPEAARDGS